MTTICKMDEIPPGESRVTSVGGTEVAIFNVTGRLYAVGNRCPHRSGPLFRGKVERLADPETGSETVAVRCPVHGWLFELATGRCLTRPGAAVPTFDLSCEGGGVQVGCQRGAASGPSPSSQVP